MSLRNIALGGPEPGRIYVTSPSFGIDLSVNRVDAELTIADNYSQDFLCGTPMMLIRSFYDISYELKLKFHMPSFSIFLPSDRERIFLLDNDKPIPPRLPLWLPPGAWKCEYCDTLQAEALLQCRNCGAIRFEAKSQ